jgi:hypothetical protein
MRTVVIISGLGLVLTVGLTLWRFAAWRGESQEINQWVTYNRLLYLAEQCDKFKEEHGAWPISLSSLWSTNFSMNDPWSKDAWGRTFVFTPYRESPGYGVIISYGQDGSLKGTGLNRDLEVRFPSTLNAAWNKQTGVGVKEPRIRP